MNDKQLPASMVEAAAAVWDEHTGALIDEDEAGWFWHCDCGASGRSASEDECCEDTLRHEIRAVLAAALDGCEVRRQFRRIWTATGIEAPWVYEYTPPISMGPHVDEQRLVITTPPEAVVDTPNEGDQQ